MLISFLNEVKLIPILYHGNPNLAINFLLDFDQISDLFDFCVAKRK